MCDRDRPVLTGIVIVIGLVIVFLRVRVGCSETCLCYITYIYCTVLVQPASYHQAWFSSVDARRLFIDLLIEDGDGKI